MHRLTFPMLPAIALLACGCGELHRTMVYDGATFTGPAAGDYNRLSVGELPAVSKVQHSTIAEVYVRLDDGTVWEVARITEDQAQARFPHPTDVNGLSSYQLHPQVGSLFFRGGRLVGAVVGDGIAISRHEQGPFVTLPLSAAEVRAAFGTPRREASFRAPMKWN